MSRAFLLLLLVATGASAAPATFCDGLLSAVDPKSIPAGLKALMDQPDLVHRVGFLARDADAVAYFDQIARSIEGSGPRSFTLPWRKSKVVATVVPEGGTDYRILLEPGRKPRGGDVMDLHALQFGLAHHLFENVSPRSLKTITFEWSNETRIFLDGRETMARLGYTPLEVEKNCGLARKIFIGTGVVAGAGVGGFTGLAVGPFLDDAFGDGQDLEESSFVGAGAGGLTAGAGATAFAVTRCKSRTIDSAYLLEVSRAPKRVKVKKRTRT